MHYPKRRQHASLFALAQTYLPHASRQQHQCSPRRSYPEQFHQGSRAFDLGETVELSYRDRTDTRSTPLPTSSGGRFFDQGDAIALSYPNQDFGAQTIDVTAFSVSDKEDEEAVALAQVDDDDWVADFDNEARDYTVEGFEYSDQVEDDDWIADSDNEASDYTVEGFEYNEPLEDTEEIDAAFEWDEQAAAMAADTLNNEAAMQAAVVTPDATMESLQSTHTSSGSGVASELALADHAFAADLQAILSGAKTYDAARSQETHTLPRTSPPMQETAPNTQPHKRFDRLSQVNSQDKAPLDPSTAPGNNAHSIFDRLGSSLAQATSFDLGTVALEQRLDEIERQLDQQEVHQSTAKTATGNRQQQTTSESLQLDPTELVEDLALIKQMSHNESLPDAAAPVSSAQEVEQALPETEALSQSEVQAEAPSTSS